MLEELVYIVVGVGLVVWVYRLWFSRRSASPNTSAIVCLALTGWWTLFWVQKLIPSEIWQGHGIAHGYGGDKAMFNFLLEPLLVASLAAVLSTTVRQFSIVGRLRNVATVVALGAAIVIVAAVPALPD